MLNACIYPSLPAPFPREAHFRFLMLLLVLPSAQAAGGLRRSRRTLHFWLVSCRCLAYWIRL